MDTATKKGNMLGVGTFFVFKGLNVDSVSAGIQDKSNPQMSDLWILGTNCMVCFNGKERKEWKKTENAAIYTLYNTWN